MTSTIKYALAGLALLATLFSVKALFDHQDAEFQRKLAASQARADDVLAFVAGSYKSRSDSLERVADSLRHAGTKQRATARVARVHADSIVAAGVPDTCLPATEALNAALKAAWTALLTDSVTIATDSVTITEQGETIIKLQGSLQDLRDVTDEIEPKHKWFRKLLPSVTVGPFAGVCANEPSGGLEPCYGVGVGLSWTLIGPKE